MNTSYRQKETYMNAETSPPTKLRGNLTRSRTIPFLVEIEITPEMLEVGADALEAFPDLDLGRGYALLVTQRILEAALRAAPTENQATEARTSLHARSEP